MWSGLISDPAAPPVIARLGDRLVERGVASRATIEEAAQRAAREARPLGEVLVERGGVEEADLFRELARQHGARYADAEEVLARLDPALANAVSGRFQERRHVLPVALDGDRLIVATCDPRASVPELADALGAREAVLWLVTPTGYRRLRSAIELGQVGAPDVVERPVAPRGHELAVAESGVLDSEVVALFDALLLDAIGERASDIHLERYGDKVRVRLRIDGDLHDLARYHLTPQQHVGILNVLKINARLDISERRLPQGGRFSTTAGGQIFDLRVQTQPCLHGEHAVLRLLPQETRLLTIEDLGFPADLAARYRRLLASPAGMVLVVGPTGSGKSTTLYAGLQVLARDATRKVISIEDPIEYALDGIQQAQVHPEIGFTFAGAMRVFVRQDPDVILLGEIRDAETALEAIRASQTGHLVLTTLHANDAVDAVQRLFDLGMHPNSIASELRAVFAQRLAKRICAGCREPENPPADLLAEVFPAGVPAGAAFWHGRGCDRCSGYGTHGRIALVEYLPATRELRRGIAQHLPLDDLRETAAAAGMQSMRDHALALVGAGVIAFEELAATLPPERLGPEHARSPLAPALGGAAAAAPAR